MKIKEFNKILNSCRTKGKLNLNKIKAIPDVLRGAMVFFIVRNRGPILIDLIPPDFDRAWLNACGYLYQTKGKEFEFIHTCEHKIV